MAAAGNIPKPTLLCRERSMSKRVPDDWMSEFGTVIAVDLLA
jgi:hypothetical protein